MDHGVFSIFWQTIPDSNFWGWGLWDLHGDIWYIVSNLVDFFGPTIWFLGVLGFFKVILLFSQRNTHYSGNLWGILICFSFLKQIQGVSKKWFSGWLHDPATCHETKVRRSQITWKTFNDPPWRHWELDWGNQVGKWFNSIYIQICDLWNPLPTLIHSRYTQFSCICVSIHVTESCLVSVKCRIYAHIHIDGTSSNV